MLERQEGKKGFRPSLSTAILMGLGAGVLTGLLFGEWCAWLSLVGRAYIGLLQMSILPYMMISLIGGIGSLAAPKAVRLAVTGGVVLLASWLVAFVCVFLAPLAFPSMEAGSFFSPSLTQAKDVDFIDLYVPVNPFRSMAETVVPAVAVFSVVVGVALIGVDKEKKRGLLEICDVTTTVLTRVAVMVVRLAPLGIFAIAANAAGTMTWQEIGRLQVYMGTFVLSTLILTFVVMPGAVAVLTPFRYGEVLRASRAALITGFVTGNLFIVLPLLIENGKALFERRGLRTDETDSFIEVLIPVSFNFPNLGKLLTLQFVLFAGWYAGSPVEMADYPRFSLLGLMSLFGGVDLALPFLLDQMRIPSDMYQLYVVTGVVNGWFATLLAVMNLFAFTLIAACSATGSLRVRAQRFASFAVFSLVASVGVLLGARFLFGAMLGDRDLSQETLMHMQIASTAEAEVYADEAPPTRELSPDSSRLSQILERKTLRVGYHPDMFPFSFFNKHGELVGYDVAIMHRLAEELDVRLEFVPWTYENRDEMLREGAIDVAIGGLMVGTQRLATTTLSDAYMDVTAGLVVLDHRRDDFETWDEVREAEDLRIAVFGRRIAEGVARKLPRAEIVSVESPSVFFEAEPEAFDAILMSAEGGYAHTILHPHCDVAIPEPHVRRQLAFGLPDGERELAEFLRAWMRLQEAAGVEEILYKKWILGLSKDQKKPRWCVMRDVLGWID